MRTKILVLCAVVPALALALALALTLVGSVLAQTSPSYNLEWHVIGGGGQPVGSAHYAVNSTAGQGAASPPCSTSAHYTVSGGYWFSIVYRVYLPLVLRKYP
jgi:hypothetical protein